MRANILRRHAIPFVAVVLLGGTGAFAQRAPGGAAAQPGPASPQEVIVYHAGSLNAEFDSLGEAFTKLTGIKVTHRGMGSVEAARRVTVGKEPCDIYASADYMTIDAFMKPAYADYTIQFAQSRIVLAYTTASRNAASIADPKGPAFAPPASLPNAVADWYKYLIQPGVRIGGSDPSADPGGYRALMVLQLAQPFYGIPTLYQDFFRNHVITSQADRLGTHYDYQLVYEHSARASAGKDPQYRYVRLPVEIDLSSPARAAYYGQAAVTIAGLASTDAPYVMRGGRAIFGLAVLKNAPHREAAIRFLQFMLSPRPGEGVELQTASGPEPVGPNGPAWASVDDYVKLPGPLAQLVKLRP
jgi:molybdate/tungstate transport system substrate-binding protein